MVGETIPYKEHPLYTHTVQYLISLVTADCVDLVAIIYGVVAELVLYGDEVCAGFLRLQGLALGGVAITIDSPKGGGSS